MINIGLTLDEHGKEISVYECSICGFRYAGKTVCINPNCGKEEKLTWKTQ